MAHHRTWSWRCAGIMALGIAPLSLPVAPAARAIHAPTPTWLRANTHTKTASLILIAGWHFANGGLNFDGYSNGRMVVTVPLRWTVRVTFSNQSDAPHSAAVIAYHKPVPETGFKVAFQNAASPHPTEGITRGDKPQTFAFRAATVGTYMLICAVPGHASGGMWETFVVAKTARTATLTIKT